MAGQSGSKPGGPQSRHLTPRHGKGAGHGGPAKGAGKKASLIEIAGEVGPDSNPTGKPGYHAMAKAERIAALKDMLWDIAQTGERDADKTSAINSLLNREEGMPVQQIINTELPVGRLTLAQLDTAIAIIERSVGGALGIAEGGQDEAAIGKPVGIL